SDTMRTMIAAAACLAAGCADAGASARAAASSGAVPAGTAAPAVRGFVTYGREGPLLRPCGHELEMAVGDSTGGVLPALYARLSGGEGPVFMELRGAAIPLADSAGEPPVSLVAREVRYAAPVMDARGCDDGLEAVEIRAGGADPRWSVSVAPGGITVARPGDGARIGLPYAPPARDGGALVYTAGGGGHLLELLVAERPCRDAEGAWSALSARAVLDGRVLRGCARQGGLPVRSRD
ncbi:MAG TPA: hypothetical protein VFR81_25160, partial [Longimicrobium sp.]|nr:hypothetical protein [Longimicrobium sp.]